MPMHGDLAPPYQESTKLAGSHVHMEICSVSEGGMGIKSDIEYAIYSHDAWKARFRSFLSGKTGLDLSAIGHTESCKLGKWLADEARRMLSPEDHVKTCELHPHFHRVAGDIVHDIKQKNFSAARQALGAAGAFDQANQASG